MKKVMATSYCHLFFFFFFYSRFGLVH
jgi:hypothetical protein